MKTWLRALAAVFGSLLLAIAWRTFSLHAPATVEPVQAVPAELDSKIIARHLGEAIRFATISHEEGSDEQARQDTHRAFAGLHQWIAQSYPHVAAKLRRESVGDSLL
ncbi:hypothetical protein ACNFBT_21895 [Pseudomonas sp. NY15181]|uniref:hypothetical protein n=1 Tax=Pseudomonas sp. NY15181 TaxID=3400349 RepID=UPI003A870707